MQPCMRLPRRDNRPPALMLSKSVRASEEQEDQGERAARGWCSSLKGRLCISRRKMSCPQDLQSGKKHFPVSQASNSPIKPKTWVCISGSNIPVIKDWASSIPFLDTQQLHNNFERLVLLSLFSRTEILSMRKFSELSNPQWRAHHFLRSKWIPGFTVVNCLHFPGSYKQIEHLQHILFMLMGHIPREFQKTRDAGGIHIGERKNLDLMWAFWTSKIISVENVIRYNANF